MPRTAQQYRNCAIDIFNRVVKPPLPQTLVDMADDFGWAVDGVLDADAASYNTNLKIAAISIEIVVNPGFEDRCEALYQDAIANGSVDKKRVDNDPAYEAQVMDGICEQGRNVPGFIRVDTDIVRKAITRNFGP